jgi:hypothetical protein
MWLVVGLGLNVWFFCLFLERTITITTLWGVLGRVAPATDSIVVLMETQLVGGPFPGRISRGGGSRI